MTCQNCKNDFFIFFVKNLKISIKKNFPNRFFSFSLKCVQGRVHYSPILVLNHGHFLKVGGALKMILFALSPGGGPDCLEDTVKKRQTFKVM